MNMSPIPFDDCMRILHIAGIVGCKNHVSTMKSDHWCVSRRNVDMICPTVQVSSLTITPILTQVRNVAQIHVTPVFFHLHVNNLFPYESWKDLRLRKATRMTCGGAQLSTFGEIEILFELLNALCESPLLFKVTPSPIWASTRSR